MESTQTNRKVAWIENIRLVAIIAVITVHIAAFGSPLVFNAQGNTTTSWWAVNFYESVCRCCVPLFVMITGSLLLPQTVGLRDFLKKRLARILFPFVFWSLIYIALNLFLKTRSENLIDHDQLAIWFTSQWINGAQFHLWYVYMLIGLYLFIPILQPWTRAAGNKTIIYFLCLCILTIALNQFKILTVRSPLDLRYFGGYVAYLVLGYYLGNRSTQVNNDPQVGAALFMIGLVSTFTGTFLATKSRGAFSEVFYNYLTLNVFILSSGAFLLLKNWRENSSNSMFIRGRDLVNTYGFGIYLCHPLIITAMSRFKLNYAFITPFIGIPLSACICLLLSCMLIYVLSKLPYGRYIIT